MNLPTPSDSRLWIQRLRTIFKAMDAAYDRAAAAYGFHCTGCKENCCMTRFHHHTLLEHLLLKDGLTALSARARQAAINRAADVCRQSTVGDPRAAAPRIMCPLNLTDRCLTYAYRPMICRLHGIPHELHRPNGEVLYGPGCEAFSKQCGRQRYVPFDRTTYYRELAALEGELRQASAFADKIRMTVAEMVVAISGNIPEQEQVPDKIGAAE